MAIAPAFGLRRLTAALVRQPHDHAGAFLLFVKDIVPNYFFCNRLKMQFEQAHFERERFLHVGVQEPLGLLQRL